MWKSTNLVDISIVTWNVQHESENIDDKINYIYKFDIDFICLQELDFYQEVTEKLNDQYNSIFIGKKGHNDGCALFYKTKFELKRKIYEQIIPEHDKLVHGFILADFKYQDKIITIITTHLKAYAKCEKNRVNQVNAILTRFQDINNPIIFAGDFNTRPYSKTYNLIIENNYNPVNINNSDPSLNPTILIGDDRYQTFDYIFYKNNILCSDTFIDNTNTLSDHLPIGAKFIL